MKIATIARNGLAAIGSVFYRAATLWRGKHYYMTWPGGPSGTTMNWWQTPSLVAPRDMEKFGPVLACRDVISQEVSRVPLRHFRVSDNVRTPIQSSTALRVFRRPNGFQTSVDFLLSIMRSLLIDGNAYGYATRDDRGVIQSITPINHQHCWPFVDPATGTIFYRIAAHAANEVIQLNPAEFYPQRDILHIRLHTPQHPLVGESPLVAGVAAVSAGESINAHTATFFSNMARPSGILRYPQKMSESAVKRIKERFAELTTQTHSGEPVVLTQGAEWMNQTMSAVDAEIIKSFNLTEKQIAQIFRVPLFMLAEIGDLTINNVEALIRFFLGSGLGFYVTHLERAFERFFDLSADQELHFDTEAALLRSDFATRVEAYAKGIQGGLYAPNEARRREGLPPKDYGDDVRVQQQLVPLSFGAEQDGSEGITSASVRARVREKLRAAA